MIGLIVARSKNNVIGKNGKIPWRIKGEQKQFKKLTTGNVVVMGRKSYEEIGHPLPDRLNIIVSRTAVFEGENLLTASSVEEAVSLAKDKEALRRANFTPKGEPDIYISGGYGLYKEAVFFVDKMYITEVDTVVEDGTVFFPEFDAENFDVRTGESGGDEIRFTRTIYTRRVQQKKVGDRELTYRKLTEADLDAFIRMRISQLTEEYASEGREVPKNVDLEAALKDYYNRHLADGTFVSWLALKGERIVGTSGMSFVEKPPYFSCPSGRLGLLSSMFTDPACRRMGIAQDLLNRVVGEARDYGCGAVWITASDMGVKLYTAYGFEHNGNFMQYKI